MVTKWSSVKQMPKRCKEFYMRCITLTIFCKNLQEANDIILSIFITVSNESEGGSLSTNERTTCEIHKYKLLRLIKYSKNKNSINATEGGPFIEELFSQIDEDIISIVKPVCVEGHKEVFESAV